MYISGVPWTPDLLSSNLDREIRDEELDKNEELYNENAWKECMSLMPENPTKMYKTLFAGRRLPIMARLDGYDENSDPYVSSYGKFEKIHLADLLTPDYEQASMSNNILLKNNIFVDLQSSKIGTINRVDMNRKEGFCQNTIIAGKVSDKDQSEYQSWFNDEQIYRNGDLMFVKPQIFASRVSELGFERDNIGTAQYFFEDRDDFTEAFFGDPFGAADALIVNDARNPEFIGFQTNLMGVTAFDNILAYTNAAGMPTFADMCSFMVQINYFVHEVLNVLIPKQIVLVMDTYKGLIDIPRKDYIPNIADPLLNIPDYNNRMRHIVNMMKLIAQKGLMKMYVGNCYIKLSITPAIFVINFISSYAPQLRLVMALGTVDNQILYDSECKNDLFPAKFAAGRTSVSNDRVITNIGESYYDRLNGVSDDVAQYAAPYRGNFRSPPTIYPANKEYTPNMPTLPISDWIL
jgi:hypothetical protein